MPFTPTTYREDSHKTLSLSSAENASHRAKRSVWLQVVTYRHEVA